MSGGSSPLGRPLVNTNEPAGTVATTITSGSPAVPSIPADAQAFDGNHYKFIRGNVGWHDAKRQCESIGGHLVIINNDGEQDFVNSLIRNVHGYVYIGLTNEETQGEWKWTDGRSLTFAKWAPGEPNNAGGVEHWGCINARHGLWLDIAKTHPKVVGFVCQWDGKAHSTPSESPVANGDSIAGSWVVLFRSADPSIWNTDTQRGADDFARLLSAAPPHVLRLRMRRIDTGEGIIIPMEDQQLDANNFTTNDRLDFGMANGRMVWYGEKSKKKGAYHIGIIDPTSRIPSGADQGKLAVPIWGNAYKCWGFGHAHLGLGPEHQLCGWAGQPLPPTVFEIAVTSSSGTEPSLASDGAISTEKRTAGEPLCR